MSSHLSAGTPDWLTSTPARSHVTGSHEGAFLFQHQFNGVLYVLISLPGHPASCAAPRCTDETSGGIGGPIPPVPDGTVVLGRAGGQQRLWLTD